MNRLVQLLLTNLLFVITIGLFGQSNEDLLPQDESVVKIKGVVKGAKDHTSITFLFYKDYITFEEVVFTAPIVDEQFSFELPVYVATSGYLTYNSQSIPVFITAEDEFTLQSTHSDFIPSLEYTGKGALRNNYLKNSFVVFEQEGRGLLEDGMLKKTSADFVEFMDEYKQRKQTHLEEYLATRDTFFSEDFQKYIEIDINYWWGKNMFQYRNHHPASHILPVTLHLPNAFYDFVDQLELNNEDALNNIQYLKYLDHYTHWQQDRIEKGIINIPEITPKRQVTISRIETFGKVLLSDLQVRAKAHDQESIITTLSKEAKVLYLRDITNDKFKFYKNDQGFIDFFVKIRLADGREGWVCKSGIEVFEDEITELVTIEAPKGVEDYLSKAKYSNFKGKVLHHVITKDIYRDIETGKRVTQSDLDNYILHSPYGAYVQLLQGAYAARKYSIPPSSLRGTADDQEVTAQIDQFAKNLTNLLELTEQQQEKPIVKTKWEETEVMEAANKKPAKVVSPVTPMIPKSEKVILSEIAVSPVNFSPYQQTTYLRFNTSFTYSDKPSIVFSQNPFLNDLQERKLGNRSTGRSFITFSADLSTPSHWKLKNGLDEVDLYFEPGDDIKIEIRGSDIYSQTTFSGSNSVENSYLLAQAAAFRHIKNELQQKVALADPFEFKQWITQVRQQKLDLYYKWLHTLSPKFRAYAEADINYWYGQNLMNYLYEHPLLNDESFPMEAPEGYLDFIPSLSVFNDAALPNKQYISYIHEYLAYLQKLPENRGKSRYELSNIYLSGKTQDFIKVILLSIDAATPSKRAALSHQLNQFERLALDKVYVEFAKIAFHKAKGLGEGMFAPEFTLVDQYGKTVRLSDMRGEVVLLDFWATWCGPCREMQPIYDSLQEKYKGKGINFVFISMDNSKQIWKNYLATKRMGGQHLIANEATGFKSPISEDYQIPSLPYALLIDPKGTIVWKRNGGFSVANLTKLIDQLLKVE